MKAKNDAKTELGNATQNAQEFVIPILAVALSLFLGAVIFYLFMFGSKLSAEHARWAEFGDFFGGLLNPIFGLAGLIALLYTIILQSKALDQSSTQLSLTREEVEKSTRALVAQNDSMVEQRIDNTFFQLLKTHNEIVNAFELNLYSNQSIAETKKGRSCFEYYRLDLDKIYRELIADEADAEHNPKIKMAVVINATYLATFTQHQANLGHYFRFLFNFFRYIDNEVMEEEKREFYVKLVRSPLSDYELVLLFYSCLSELGRNKFYNYVEKFALLKNLRVGLLLDESHLDIFYTDDARRSEFDNYRELAE